MCLKCTYNCNIGSMRSFCQLVVAAIAVGTMNWKSVIDVANWWM